MKLEEFLRLLRGVSQKSGYCMAKCPAHDDKKASLSITKGDNGKILLHCHAGCPTESICESLGLTMKDLFDEPVKAQEAAQIVATYDYTDLSGDLLLAQKLRKSDKTFAWRRPDGRGGWEYNRKGLNLLPYNAANIGGSKAVYLVEGEKDVNTLKRIGKAAVSLPDGAGSKWKDSYTEVFKGKHVAIIEDNDEPGRKFAAMAAEKLHGNAASVRILDLTRILADLSEHGDTTDLIMQMGDTEGIEAITRLARETEEWEPVLTEILNETQEVSMPDFYSGNRFLHNVMGDYLTEKYGVCKINGAIHIYDNGIYKRGEEALHGFMLELIPTLTDAKRREVYKYIKVSRKTPEKEVSPPYLIPFATRIYNIRDNVFLDYSPEHVFLNRFPYDYIPNAPECKIITNTIREIASGDEEVISLLYEAIGNCFYMLNSFRGAVMLYGRRGNNGKSTLLNMITRMLGRKNASFLTLQDTAERFRLADIYGKAANIGDDIPSTYLPESATFKKLVTGEYVTAEKKGQDPFSFKSYAKLFFAMNDLPAVSDKSKAFFGRTLIIPLNQDFSQCSTLNTDLKNREWTKEEMECLTRLAVEGLKRLLKNGDFTRPACVMQAVAEYEADNNPVKAFLQESGDIEGKKVQDVYQHFTAWCWQNGHKNVITRTKFTREVTEQTGYKSIPTREGDKTPRCFQSKGFTL